jgi:hypothetical protein
MDKLHKVKAPGSYMLTLIFCIAMAHLATGTSRLDALKEIQSRHLILMKMEYDSTFYPKAKGKKDIDPEKMMVWNDYVSRVDQINSIMENNFGREWKFNQKFSTMTYTQIHNIPKKERMNYSVLAISNTNLVWTSDWDYPYWVAQRLSDVDLDLSRPEKCDYFFSLPCHKNTNILFSEWEFIISMRFIQKQFNYSLDRKFFCVNFFDYCSRELNDHAAISCKQSYIITEEYLREENKKANLEDTRLVLMKDEQIIDLVKGNSSDTSIILLRFYAEYFMTERYQKEPFYPAWPRSPEQARLGEYSAERCNSHIPFSPDSARRFMFVAIRAGTGEVFFVTTIVDEYIKPDFILKYLMCN